MELVAVILSIVNLIILSLLLGRLHGRPIQIEFYVPPVPEPIEDQEALKEAPLPTETEVLPSTDDESAHAWKNQKEIPLSFARQSVAGGQPPPPSGPLERPSGFAR